MNGFVKFFTTPSLVRTIVIIAIVVLIFLIIYWWRSSRKRREQEEQFEEDYQTLSQGNGQKPTYLQTNYQEFANKIYAAGCSGLFCYGTDEEAMYDVFRQMKNDLDVLLLVKAFGLRQERGGICIPIPGTGECEIPLGQWLPTELSADGIKEINTILSKQGINYKF